MRTMRVKLRHADVARNKPRTHDGAAARLVLWVPRVASRPGPYVAGHDCERFVGLTDAMRRVAASRGVAPNLGKPMAVRLELRGYRSVWPPGSLASLFGSSC
jgi:hypothetical protein